MNHRNRFFNITGIPLRGSDTTKVTEGFVATTRCGNSVSTEEAGRGGDSSWQKRLQKWVSKSRPATCTSWTSKATFPGLEWREVDSAEGADAVGVVDHAVTQSIRGLGLADERDGSRGI